MKITKPYHLTQLGCRVEQFEVHEAGQYGVRWIYTHHIDQADERNGGWSAGTYTRRQIKGNGLKGTLVELVARHAITADQYEQAKTA